MILLLNSNNVNSMGLIFDLAGIVLLFIYGLPPEINPGGKSYRITGETDESEARKYKRYKCWSFVALFLLLIGFMLQLISNYI